MKRVDDRPGEEPRKVPIHCSYCGTLLGYFSPTSHADLELRCANCKNDYSVTLREEVTALAHRRSRKKPLPAG